MSTLFLMRHGQAGPARSDSERPLTSVGRARAEAVGHLLRGLRGERAPVLCSPARRCRETAESLALGPPRLEEGLALDGPLGGLVDLARRCPPGTILVGHQPELMGLLSALLPEGVAPPFTLPPGALVGLERSPAASLLSLYLEGPAATAWTGRIEGPA